jgi:hypothetical protein
MKHWQPCLIDSLFFLWKKVAQRILFVNPKLSWCFDICRHPRGQYDKCAENARERLIDLGIDSSTTYICVGISEFGGNLFYFLISYKLFLNYSKAL